MKKIIINVLVIMLINIIVLVILYCCFVVPIYMDNTYMFFNRNEKKMKIYEYYHRYLITDFDNNIFIDFIKEHTNLYNKKDINMDNVSSDAISLNKLRVRISASYTLSGNYENIDDLKDALSGLDIEESEIYPNQLINALQTDYMGISIYIDGNNKFFIEFFVNIAKYGEQDMNDSIYLDYFLNLNENNCEIIENNLRRARTKVAVYMILINIIIGIILYKRKSKKCNF